LVAVNDWILATPETVLGEPLQKDDEVNIPDPDFTPLLAARFAAEAMVAAGLSHDERTLLIQRLVRMALPNPTAADTVLGRLILSTLAQPQPLPAMLRDLPLPNANADEPTDFYRLDVL
jgi:hypothetical protein